jgi:hypothetical protein
MTGDEASNGTSAARRADLRIAARLALTFFLFFSFFARGFFHGSDEVGVFETTESICERGDLSVPAAPHAFAGRDGRIYSHFAVGQSLAAAPLYWMGKAAARVLPESWVRAAAGETMEMDSMVFGGSVEIFMVGFYSHIVSALLVGLFFLFERRLRVSLRNSLIASVLLGGTTYVAAMSVYFLQHTTEALAMMAALYGFHAWRESGRIGALAAGSTAASLIILIRIPAVVAGPALCAYLAWTVVERRRLGSPRGGWAPVLAAVLVPLLVVLGLHVAVNHAKWGTWVSSPMLDQVQAMVTPLYVGLFGLLLSPGCSIFAYSPLLLLVPYTLPAFWRSHRAECAAILGICLSLLFFHAKFTIWSGLWSSPGPRYLFALTPLLMLALGPWLDLRRTVASRVWVGVLGLAGAAVQFVLMGARWGSVVQAIRDTGFRPELSFVYYPEFSPIRGSTLLLLQRHRLDTWIWRLAEGWPGQPRSPTAALVLAALWVAGMALCVWSLRRMVRNHP